jgi:FkbH-like protein
MIQAQLERETVRKQLSHEEFLQTLGLRLTLSVVRATKDLHMSRALELFNKTNQFNTTGARYTLEQCHQFLLGGCQLHVLQAEDRLIQYGLIGAAWVRQNCIDHLVMSCRAFGLGIEDAFLAHLANRLARENVTVMFGQLQPTDANLACRQLYSRNGFTQLETNSILWSRSLAAPLVVPPHDSLTEG